MRLFLLTRTEHVIKIHRAALQNHQ
jgi:hypothetical protein